MQSTLLAEKGLINQVAGSEYNFRYQMVGNKVVEDVERLLERMDIQPKEIYTGQQVHSANVAYVNGQNGEPFIFGRTLKETDGLLTDKPGVALLIKYADCTPIILYDPVKKVQAVVHSGWRGTVQKISLNAIKQMEADFGCARHNILAYVGPSIDQEHYQVGPEVYAAFEGFSERDNFFKPDGERYRMSMSDANVSILKEAGIKDENLDIERTATYTDDSLHSARKEGKEYQLNGLLTMIPEE
ncbi:peptidoglycan editing factor PgeF [Lacticigenium naphthae]|uniref:peptidoglycan editing factor PgeF n=1 Tax=Lacticigenium naphthae TaxID=515351 RepID=UPI0004136A63|nr:peptidoglycan editing factor PgeF [Lacticigenium naphthae]